MRVAAVASRSPVITYPEESDEAPEVPAFLAV